MPHAEHSIVKTWIKMYMVLWFHLSETRRRYKSHVSSPRVCRGSHNAMNQQHGYLIKQHENATIARDMHPNDISHLCCRDPTNASHLCYRDAFAQLPADASGPPVQGVNGSTNPLLSYPLVAGMQLPNAMQMLTIRCDSDRANT